MNRLLKKIILASLLLVLPYCDYFNQIFNEKNVLHEVNEIEKIVNFDVRHLQHQGECGLITLSLYSHDNILKKIFYSYSEGCAVEDGINLLEYFDDEGNPLKVAYHSQHGKGKKVFCLAGRGNANFISRSKIVSGCSELSPENGNMIISEKFLPVCEKNIPDLESLFEKNQYCYFSNAQYIRTLADNTRKDKEKIVSSLDYFAKGSFVNSIKVNMRKDPSQASESLGHLYPLESVKILEKGPEETVEGVGTNHWFRVEVKSYVYLYQGSMYRKDTQGWVFGTFIHQYLE